MQVPTIMPTMPKRTQQIQQTQPEQKPKPEYTINISEIETKTLRKRRTYEERREELTSQIKRSKKRTETLQQKLTEIDKKIEKNKNKINKKTRNHKLILFGELLEYIIINHPDLKEAFTDALETRLEETNEKSKQYNTLKTNTEKIKVFLAEYPDPEPESEKTPEEPKSPTA